MSPKKIEVGKTYKNKGKGTTHRKVIAIGFEYRPGVWLSDSLPPNEPGVLFEQYIGYDDILDYEGTLYLSSFASWVGGEV